MEVIFEGMGELLQPPDIDAFREWNRQKPKAMVDKRMAEADAVDRYIAYGCYPDTELYGNVRDPMSITREIIRQG